MDKVKLQYSDFDICITGPGDEIVRAGFNPSKSSGVDRLKVLAAAFINEVEIQGVDSRAAAMAQTAAEEAAMWAVKSATAEKLPRNAN